MSTTDLPALNAVLNSAAAVLLLIGLWHIRARRIAQHKRAMFGALLASVAFLVSYLTYHSLHGSKSFEGPPLVRKIYLGILLVHTVLAAVNLPMVIVTVARALKEQFDRHKRIARWTWGIWMFVSVSGVVIYLMNYQIWPGRSLAQRAFDAGYAAHRALDDAEALELYRKAEGMGHVGASCLAAVVADRIEKTDTASAAVSAVLARFPDDPHCLVIRGRQHILAGDAKRGRAVLVKAVERLPNDAFAFATLAFAQFRLHEYADAAKSFERSIELDPSMPANIYNAGYAHFLYGNYPKARPLLERALQAGIDAELAERAKRDLGIIDGTLWMCPMHAHVTGDKGDKCGECGMDLEPAARGMGSDTIEDGQ